MSELQTHLSQIIARCREFSIPIRPGIDAETLDDFESRYTVKLPKDLREYFATVDGTGDHYEDEYFYRFWPLKDVKPIQEYVPELLKKFPDSCDYFFFFDHSIDLSLYAIRLCNSEEFPTPIAHVFPQQNALSFDPFCETFSEFISKYADDPGRIL